MRTGRALSLSGHGCQVVFGGPPGSTGCAEGTNHGKVRLTSSGAGAYELSDLATATTSLQAFGPSGARTKLADGAVDTLRLTRTQVVWTQGAVEHRAPLPR